MPEDDDLNFAIVALTLVEQHGEALTTDDVAAAWLSLLPGGRVFTAERIAYRNLLDGHPPAVAGRVGNPFQDWIGAQIRTDVYGWVLPGDPARAARLAWQDGRLSHSRNGLYGAMFVAAASSVAVVASSIGECVEAGLSVVPAASRYAAAIRRGTELGHSRLDPEAAIDTIYAEFGHLHWVHVLNNAALLAFALTRSEGDFATAITTVVSGGWDTDSTGATAGSICGAAHRRDETAVSVDRAARQPPGDEHAGLRRHRLRRAGPANGGGATVVTVGTRPAGAAADRPADDAAAPRRDRPRRRRPGEDLRRP